MEPYRVFISSIMNTATEDLAGERQAGRAAAPAVTRRLLRCWTIRSVREREAKLLIVVSGKPSSHGEFEVILKDGSRSRISRTYRRQLEKRLGQSL
jgi:two-component system LytT family response regulator